MTKILALYLPQFHQIKENDEWWGEGFTEWNNVKRGKKYAKGQSQPRVPLNQYYYDLSDYKTIEWQAGLAQEYGIDGFMFYHYYYTGKRLLSKPAELLLEHKEIDIEFCFSWANHDWKRTWASYNQEMLWPQEYGSDEDISDHFDYLLPFFKDSRYIKVEGKPFFSIYANIQKDILQRIQKIFTEKAKANGFAGMYFVETLNGRTELSDSFDAHFVFEPNYSIANTKNMLFKFNYVIRQKLTDVANCKGINHLFMRVNYETVCQMICDTAKRFSNDISVFPGFFRGWDNTPRHGIRGRFYYNESPDTFQRYLEKLYSDCSKSKKEFLVINAWNEWGEGAYLEPDEKDSYEYLKAIKSIKEHSM